MRFKKSCGLFKGSRPSRPEGKKMKKNERDEKETRVEKNPINVKKKGPMWAVFTKNANSNRGTQLTQSFKSATTRPGGGGCGTIEK